MIEEINAEYVKKYVGKDLPKKNIDIMLNAMKKYGNNRWWESEDLIEIAKYQFFEKVLLVDFSRFHKGLEKLLDRPVYTHEIGRELEEEVKYAIKRVKNKIGVSDEYRETAFRKSIEMLEDFCKKNGKKLLKFEIQKQKPEKDDDGIDISGYDGYLNPE